jgi:hypothetical protein
MSNSSSLGCYSIIRYRDALSDQQVNIGLLLWHPEQGYRVFFAPNLDGAHVIAPKVPLQDLKFRLNVIEQQVNENGKPGPEKFEELSNWFREGIEVTSPYPARFEDLESALHLLRPTLFPQMPPEPKALALEPSVHLTVRHAIVTQFEKRVFMTIERAAGERHIQAHPVPPRKIGKLIVNPGLQTIAGKHRALWRVVAFRSNENLERQLLYAKSIAAEMHVLSETPQFKGYERLIVVPAEKPVADTDEPIAWLQRAANHVWSLDKPEAAEKLLDRALKSAS